MANSLRRNAVTGAFAKKSEGKAAGIYQEVSPRQFSPKKSASDKPSQQKVTKSSGRVIKEVSSTHQEALKRLVDK